MNEFIKQDEYKLKLKMVFNDDFNDNFIFANSEHMEIVLKYGMAGYSFVESLEKAKLQADLSLKYASTGRFLNDDDLFEMIIQEKRA
jgi:hypothetical protein